MPVNSFDDYPMAWKPEKGRLSGPLYRAIAEALEEDILAGKLPPDTKLPPQRELADFLDVNLSTVTRAYKECELKGLLYATVGKGTFVAPNARTKNVPFQEKAANPVVEMGMIEPFYQVNARILDAARAVVGRREAIHLLEYGQAEDDVGQRQAARDWLARFHVDVPVSNILIAAGSQNALAISLISLFKAGDRIATDPYTYPNFIGLASFLHIQLVAVECDADGMKPEALDSLCRTSAVRGVYLMPSCSNPMDVVMPMERREQLAQVIRRHRLTVLEDDAYAFLLPASYKPIAALLPEQTVYICGTSKSLCAGLRVAFLAFPDSCRAYLAGGVYTINLKTVSLNAAIIAELIRSGQAEEILEIKRSLTRERNRIFREIFGQADPEIRIDAYFKWLPLPAGMDGARFEQMAAQRGVHVLSSGRFAVGARDAAYIRLALSSPRSSEELRRGLTVVRELLEEGGAPDFIV